MLLILASRKNRIEKFSIRFNSKKVEVIRQHSQLSHLVAKAQTADMVRRDQAHYDVTVNKIGPRMKKMR